MLINSKCGAGLVQGAMPTARANPCRLSCTWATRRWLVHHEACSDHCWRNVRNISHNVKRCHYVCSHKSNFCVSEWVSTLVSHPTQYRSFRRRSNFCVQPHCCVSPLPCFKLLKRSFGPTQIYSFPVAPERIWKWGRHTSEKFFVVPLHFSALQVQLVVLMSAFVMVTTAWSVSCLLLFYSRCPVPNHL